MATKVARRWRTLYESSEAAGSRATKFAARVFLARSSGDLPNELKGEFDKQKKRPNPKARRKMAKRRREARLGGDGSSGGAGQHWRRAGSTAGPSSSSDNHRKGRSKTKGHKNKKRKMQHHGKSLPKKRF